MKDDISITILFELYLDTIEKCGIYLLSEDDELIEYNIFEEFTIGIDSFFYIDNLLKLHKEGLIEDDILFKSIELRNRVIELQQSNLWNIDSVKSSKEWRTVLALSDQIRKLL